MRLIYFAPVTIESYWQRPHFLIREFSRLMGDMKVLWVDPYPTRWPKWSDLRRPSDRPKTESAEWQPYDVLRPRALPIEPLPGSAYLNGALTWYDVRKKLREFANRDTIIGIGRPSKLALWALKNLPAQQRFFDAMDDFPAFYSGWSRRAFAHTEMKIASAVDLIVCSSSELYETWRKTAQHQRIGLVPNAYAMEQLPPINLKRDAKGIGYVGTLADWFDWDVVVELAQALPDIPVTLAGPLFALPPRLPSNVQLLPACSISDAIVLLQNSRVGIIPFRQSLLTDSVDPVKYYEMRGLGLPIWTTSFGEMTIRINSHNIREIRPGTDWATLWQETLQLHSCVDDIEGFRRANDWTSRAKQLACCLGL